MSGVLAQDRTMWPSSANATKSSGICARNSGGEDELNKLWDETKASVVAGEQPAPKTEPEEPEEKSDALKEIEKQFAGLGLEAKDEDGIPSAGNTKPSPPSKAQDKVAASPSGEKVAATEKEGNSASDKAT